jgi:hypothetical protein
MTTLEKVRRLEKYIATDDASVDTVLDLALDKMLSREIERLLDFQKSLQRQLDAFENQYNMGSSAFYAAYEQGKMGDDMDFVEWAATIEMATNLRNRLSILQSPA